MADDLGAVRRTPRPTGDRQTPETVAQESAGTTNSPTPVSADTGNGTDDLRAGLADVVSSPIAGCTTVSLQAVPEAGGYALTIPTVNALTGEIVDALLAAGWRAPALDEARVNAAAWGFDTPEYVALPECTACEGTGKDTHGTPFEAPLAVHIAAPHVTIDGRRRQLCAWCGHVLLDTTHTAGLLDGEQPSPPWPDGHLIRIEDGVGAVVPYQHGKGLPPGCCALPDDEQYTRTASSGPTTQGIPDETESTLDGCICTENRCDYDDHDNPPTDWLCVPCGQLTEGTPCLALDGPDDEPADDGLCERCPGLAVEQLSFPGQRLCQQHLNQAFIAEAAAEDQAEDDGPDEAQEPRAADWPAQETDHG